MHRGHDRAAVGPCDPPELGEEGAWIGDVLEDERAEHAVERGVGERERRGDVVEEEAHALGPRLRAGFREHRLREVDRGHARAREGEPDGVAAGAAADVEKVAAQNVTECPIDLGLLERQERVALGVVARSPAVVALARRHNPPVAPLVAHRTTAGAIASSSTRTASSFVKSIDVADSRKPSASSARPTCSSYERTGAVTSRPGVRARALARRRSRARSTSPPIVRTLQTCGCRSTPPNASANARGFDSSPSISADLRRIASGLPPIRCGGSYAPPRRLTSKSAKESCSARRTASGVVIV